MFLEREVAVEEEQTPAWMIVGFVEVINSS